MEKLDNLVIILKRKKGIDGNLLFVPVKVILGAYDSKRDIVIGEDGREYYHIIENRSEYGFCNRASIDNYLKDYQRLPMPLVKKLVLMSSKRFIYEYEIAEEEKDKPPVILITSKKNYADTKILVDKDIINYYLELYPLFLTGTLADMLNVEFQIEKPNDKESSIQKETIKDISSGLETSKKKESKIEEKNSSDINIDINSLYQELTSRVIGQDAPIKKILTAIWKQYNNFSEDKSRNILISGNTGVGKTEIFRTLTKAINVPCVVTSATLYTASGYVGKNVEDMLIGLLSRAGGNLEKAENGILIIDEIDKLAETGIHSQVNQKDVQEALLKLVEGTTFDIVWNGKRYSFNTNKLMVIAAGSFSRIKLDNEKVIGFDKVSTQREYSNLTREDFVNNGMIPEFIGRFPVIIKLNELSYDDLLTILNKAKDNILSLNKTFFEKAGIQITIDDETKRAIALKATKEKYGARSLDEIIETALSLASFEIAKSPDLYSELIISPETIEDNTSYKLVRKKEENR